MNKMFLRSLYPQDHLWKTDDERESFRIKLNGLGFYVLHGHTEDVLDVYAIEYDWIDRMVL